MLVEQTWLEGVTDFGHAKKFFPGTDVFPSIACARRPVASENPPADMLVTVVPRDLVRMDDLEAQVATSAFAIARADLNREPWVLEPLPVRSLIAKIQQSGTRLMDYIGGAYSDQGVLTGIKTGFNEAFIVDAAMRDRLVAEDQNSAALFRPFLRGQDIDRWAE